MKKIQNYIDGEWRDARSGDQLEVYDPSRGKVYGMAPDSDIEDVQDAIDAAKSAFEKWSNTSAEERFRIMMRISTLIEENLDDLAKAESLDNGKPLWLSKKVDIPRASSNFRFFASAQMQFSSEAHDMAGDAINYTLRQPLGVVACISPWNLPLYLFTWKVAPAMAMGNTVVAKPSEVTPLTAYLLTKICDEAGLPPGVFNVVNGLGHKVGAALTTADDVKAISFTGSTRTGAIIARSAAPKFKKLSLEMGGKNPNIIFADCNYEKMLDTTINSSFANQGQICLCGSRILVEESIYERFKNDFVERAKAIKVSDPNDPEAKISAVVSWPHYEKILSYIQLATEEGGEILCGGEPAKMEGEFDKGWFIKPTVIVGLGPECRVNLEEIFGPVVTLQSFSDEEEALRLANHSEYGLSATIWTENLSRAHRMAKKIESGIVWINTWLKRDLRTPFGGVKNSGVGREGGLEALRFFSEPKNVCIDFS